MNNSAKTVFSKSLSLMLAALLLCVAFAGCSKNTTATADTGTKPLDSISEQSSSAAVTTEPETDIKLSVNEDLLSEIGMTYGELIKKHGERVDSRPSTYGGGAGYYLKNGYGAYCWALDDLDCGYELKEGEAFPFPLDDEGNIDYSYKRIQSPKEDAKCVGIEPNTAADIIINATLPMSTEKLKDIEGVSDPVLDYTDDMYLIGTHRYSSGFNYKGFRISFYQTEEKIIDDSTVICISIIKDE